VPSSRGLGSDIGPRSAASLIGSSADIGCAGWQGGPGPHPAVSQSGFVGWCHPDRSDLYAMIMLMKRNTRFTGEIYQRQQEECERDDEEDRDAVFVGELQHGAYERDNDQQRRDDGAHCRVEDGSVQQFGSSLEAWDIRLEVRSRLILDAVEKLRSVED